MSDDDLSTFLSVRPRLFSIAYRMLGSAADAEDIVQDVWLRGRAERAYVEPCQSEPVDTRADPGLQAEGGEVLAQGRSLETFIAAVRNGDVARLESLVT